MIAPHRTLLVFVLAFTGCYRPAEVAINVDLSTRSPGLAVVTLKVKNQEPRPTTPLAIDVTVQAKQAGRWGKAESVLHPAAFVLNKQEEQILRATVKLQGEMVRTTVTVREQESGRVVKSQQIEKTLSTS